MDMPVPGVPHRRLGKLVGYWVGEETLHPSPWDPTGGPAEGRVRNRAALEGFVVVQDYEQVRNGGVSYRAHGVFSWDDAHQQYLLHWFDTMGMPPRVFQGRFENEVLALASESPQGHARATWDFREPGRYSYHMEVSGDGRQWVPFMDGRYTKRE